MHETIEKVIKESYPADSVLTWARGAANATLHHLDNNGVLEDSRTREAFQRSGLLD